MTTQKQSIEDQLRQLPDNAWKLEKQILGMDDQEIPTSEMEDNPKEWQDLPPWEDPLLIAKNTNSTDKQIFQKEKIVSA